MGATPASLAARPGLQGAMVETFALAELLKHAAFSKQGLTLWHYRTQTKIVLYTGREVVPFDEKLWAVPLSVWWAEAREGTRCVFRQSPTSLKVCNGAA